MSEATVIKPDLQFVNELINNGGESLKKCYQCATCSVVCNVTPEGNPFPRKEMVLAQWGQKDKLLASPDVWLCHQCGDCTAYCPRGAKPGEVLNAVRQQSVKHFSMIPFIAKMAQDPKLIWLLFLIPIALFVSLMWAHHGGELDWQFVRMGANGDQISYHMFVPVDPNTGASDRIKYIFGLTALFSIISVVVGIRKMWSGMKDQAGQAKASGNLSEAISATFSTIFSHSKFADCEVNRLRQWGHMLLFYSFIGLAVSSLWALVYIYGFNKMGPYPITDPMKMLQFASTLSFAIGGFIVLYNRLTQAGKAGVGSYFDWLFLGIIVGIGVTGLGAWLFRVANMSMGYGAYFIHMALVWSLLAYAPYSKFAHLFYRTTAMVFAKQSGRE